MPLTPWRHKKFKIYVYINYCYTNTHSHINNCRFILCCTMQAKFNTPNRFSQQGGTQTNNGQVSRADSTLAANSDLTANGDGSSADRDSGGEEGEDDDYDTVHTGFLKEWTLMLHGTREPPYSQLSVRDPHSKLAIVKKAHTITGPDTSASPQKQSAY